VLRGGIALARIVRRSHAMIVNADAHRWKAEP